MHALDVQDRGGRHKIVEAADQSNYSSDIFRIQSLPQGMRSKCIHKARQKLLKTFSAADIARIFLTPDFKQHLPQDVRTKIKNACNEFG